MMTIHVSMSTSDLMFASGLHLHVLIKAFTIRSHTWTTYFSQSSISKMAAGQQRVLKQARGNKRLINKLGVTEGLQS